MNDDVDVKEALAGEVEKTEARFNAEATTRLFKVWSNRYKHFHYDDEQKAGSLEITNDITDVEEIYDIAKSLEKQFEIVVFGHTLHQRPVLGYVIDTEIEQGEEDD